MQKKIAIILILIVLLPLGLLAWLGQRMAHNEQRMMAVQVQALVNAQLGGVDDTIKGVFQAVQDDFLVRLTQHQQDALGDESLKQWRLESPQIRQVLVIGADGKRVFPAPGMALSEADKQFLQRTSAIWDNPQLLTQGAALSASASSVGLLAKSRSQLLSKSMSDYAAASPLVERAASGVSSTNNVSGSDSGAPQMGWYTWHWDAQLHHIFWWRDPQNRIIGLELAPVALQSEIIARLPATGNTTDNDTAQANASTRLINGNGQIVYEWGQYRPRAGERTLAMLPLSHPLASWKLEYFAPALGAGVAGSSFNILAAVLLIGLALAGLATYLYREHSREVRLAQQRVNFVNQVSHELKTPLTNIRLYAELLETEVEDVFEDDPEQHGAKAHKYIGIITAESQRLSRLIANVLSFGQFQKAQLRLSLQTAVVDEVIARCAAAFKPALDGKAISVQLDLHASVLVSFDPEALEQILNNLISNVEKYAASGGALRIESSQDGDFSTIDVRDFGPGIAARERKRIFDPFYRVSSKLSDGVAGTGIGLDIARQLARLHGGDVTLLNVANGACFRVTLRTR